MAPRVPKQFRVMCPENQALSRFFMQKWRSLMNEPDGLSQHQSLALANAKRSISAAQECIRTLDDFKEIKGVGPWLTFHMKEFFAERGQDLPPTKADAPGENVTGKKTRGSKPYLPKKNTAAYAILITLLRAKINGQSFMLKQELIDAAEASGLSQEGIGPNRSKLKQSYGKDWYTGWSCMKTLISKELISKSSCPAKNFYNNSQIPNICCKAYSQACLGQFSTTSAEQSNCNGPSAKFSMLHKDISYMSNNMLAMPPRQSNESFLEAYEVVLILDDREKFGARTRKVADNICTQIHLDVSVEAKRLPVGDGIWIARLRKDSTEYVLDYVVERKNLSDLDNSITDNRYREQELRLKRCGLRKLIYLVEGDPKSPDVSEKAKTACFTTEILDGFDIQKTYAETERQYVYLTSSIIEYYNTNFSNLANTSHVCLTYNEFERRCKDFDKSTVSQIFALQLMQDGDTRAQEEMLQKKSKKVNAGASRNIFKLVWAEG